MTGLCLWVIGILLVVNAFTSIVLIRFKLKKLKELKEKGNE